jgi:flagellar biosynthesis protein FlhG
MRQDQAERLRLLARGLKQQIRAQVCGLTRNCRVIVITSGKGGVGKTNLAVGLSLALAGNGYKVMLLDADMGLANVDVVLGLVPKYNLSHVFSGEKHLHEILQNGPGGLQIIPGASGLEEMVNLDTLTLLRFVGEVIKLTKDLDFLFVDTSAGISRQVLSFALSADEVLVVSTPEPTALTDAYGLIKVFKQNQGSGKLKLIINMARSRDEGKQAAQRLIRVVREFLDLEVEFIGIVPCDTAVPEAVRRHQSYLLAYPHSPASLSTMRIALNLGNFSPQKTRGVQGFFESLFNYFRGPSVRGVSSKEERRS